MNQSLKNKILEKHIFVGLTDLNIGWDAPTIAYFSETDFKTVLERIEKMNFGIYGIEPWTEDNHYFDVKLFDDYSNKPNDPLWYNKAFNEFIETGKVLKYSASYFIPKAIKINYR